MARDEDPGPKVTPGFIIGLVVLVIALAAFWIWLGVPCDATC